MSTHHIWIVCHHTFSTYPDFLKTVKNSWRYLDFSAATLPKYQSFHGFQSLLQHEDQVECLESLRRHLTRNGTLIINLFVPDRNMLEQEQNKIYFIKNVPLTDDDRSITLWHSSHFDIPNQIITTRLFIDFNESGRIVESQVRDFSLRYIHRYEAEYLFKSSGFELKNLFGDFERNNFGPNSEEMIWELSPK